LGDDFGHKIEIIVFGVELVIVVLVDHERFVKQRPHA